MDSMIDRKPRAPSSCAIALSTMKSRASSSKTSLILSILNNLVNCFTRAFFGSVNIFFRASLSSGSKKEMTGKRPTISGISPYFLRSEGEIYRSIFSLSMPRFSLSMPYPIMLVRNLDEMILSIELKAPPVMNNMSWVFTGIIFCSGCFRPPCGGTLMIEPSSSFRSACWTPSPETSLVIDGLSLFRDILSISSMKTIPCSAAATL